MADFKYDQVVTATNGVGMAAKSNTYSGTGPFGLDGETAVGSGTNGGVTQMTIAIDVSAVKFFFIVADKDLTLKTNDHTSPANTLSLLAGKPYIWDSDSYDTFKLTTDVTSFFFDNADAAAATVYCGGCYDATP